MKLYMWMIPSILAAKQSNTIRFINFIQLINKKEKGKIEVSCFTKEIKH